MGWGGTLSQTSLESCFWRRRVSRAINVAARVVRVCRRSNCLHHIDLIVFRTIDAQLPFWGREKSGAVGGGGLEHPTMLGLPSR